MRNPHRNVLRFVRPVQHVDDATGRSVYLLPMEFCSIDLYEYVEVRKFLSHAEARYLFRQIVAAVMHCHAHGLYHGDIKPEVSRVCRCRSGGGVCYFFGSVV